MCPFNCPFNLSPQANSHTSWRPPCSKAVGCSWAVGGRPCPEWGGRPGASAWWSPTLPRSRGKSSSHWMLARSVVLAFCEQPRERRMPLRRAVSVFDAPPRAIAAGEPCSTRRSCFGCQGVRGNNAKLVHSLASLLWPATTAGRKKKPPTSQGAPPPDGGMQC